MQECSCFGEGPGAERHECQHTFSCLDFAMSSSMSSLRDLGFSPSSPCCCGVFL